MSPARQCVKNVFIHLILLETGKSKSIALANREIFLDVHGRGCHMGIKGLEFSSSCEDTSAVMEALLSDFF